MWESVKSLIQNFEFDTWLSIISCITGVVALFVGGKAYNNCKAIKNSFNDEKEFGDNSVDNSQKAGGDIVTYNYGCDTNALATLTSDNFKACLNQAYDIFDKKNESNLKRIIEEASRIVKENQINLGSYTKLDWINVYFENAKTASDEYMQNVWAKVLTLELEKPNSFSFKTLDILKNMTADDFRLFEKMCSLSTENYILMKDIYEKYELMWIDKLHLSELGLLRLEGSQTILIIKSHCTTPIVYLDKYILLLTNDTGEDLNLTFKIYTLSTAAKEIQKIANITVENNFIFDFAKELNKIKPSELKLSLHKINSINDNLVNYNDEDLLLGDEPNDHHRKTI